VLLSAYRTMKTPPLMVAVSLDRDEVLAAWYREATSSAALFAVVGMLLAALLTMLYRQMDAMSEAFAREHDARRDAEAASALKDQFLMTVSHELRTPLTAIGGWARMLRTSLGEGQRDAAVRTIERNVQTQTRLIDDLLDMSRVASGRLTLTLRPLNIGDVVRNAVESVRPAAEAKSIELQVSGDIAGRVNGDADRLQQVMANLLSNAVKFTPEGGRIAVSATRAGRWLEIAVTDTGCGISADFLPYVFERFRQEEAGTGRQFSGLGLGLAIVSGLVRMHAGTVAAHSDGPGRGATFTIRLPLHDAAAPAAAEDGRPQASASAR
jgi:signal transduction histidine kinase